MTEPRPMWSTTVDPSEYDVDGQMEDFVKAANKAKECYYGIDVGKLWGLYKAFKSQSDELATLRAQLAEAREALQPFAKYGEKCGEYEESDWEFRIKGKHFAKALKVYNKLVITA